MSDVKDSKWKEIGQFSLQQNAIFFHMKFAKRPKETTKEPPNLFISHNNKSNKKEERKRRTLVRTVGLRCTFWGRTTDEHDVQMPGPSDQTWWRDRRAQMWEEDFTKEEWCSFPGFLLWGRHGHEETRVPCSRVLELGIQNSYDLSGFGIHQKYIIQGVLNT